jgi:hypothetical protein
VSPLIPQPALSLCRLCRAPIPRAVLKCPYCGARQVWSTIGFRRAAARRASRLRIAKLAAGITGAAVVLVAVVFWLWILREVKAPISSIESAANPPGPPTRAECAALATQLTTPSSGERLTAESRGRFRQCLERR